MAEEYLKPMEIDTLRHRAFGYSVCTLVNLRREVKDLFDAENKDGLFVVPITVEDERFDIMEQIVGVISRQIYDGDLQEISKEIADKMKPSAIDELFYCFLDRLIKVTGNKHILIQLADCQEINKLGDAFLSNTRKRERMASFSLIHFLLVCDDENIANVNKITTIKHRIIDMSKLFSESKVFISHTWGDNSDQTAMMLHQYLSKVNIPCSIDHKDVHYMDDIREYEDILISAPVVIVDISKKYMESLNAMAELSSIFEKGNKDRILLWFSDDRKYINSDYQVDLTEYWGNELKKRKDDKAKLAGHETLVQDREIDVINRILNQIPYIIGFLVNMNAPDANSLLANNQFDMFCDKIREMLGIGGLVQNEGANKPATASFVGKQIIKATNVNVINGDVHLNSGFNF